MNEVASKVDGMSCGGCASSVTKVIQKLQPAVAVEVKGAHDAGQVKQAVESEGFDFGGPGAVRDWSSSARDGGCDALQTGS